MFDFQNILQSGGTLGLLAIGLVVFAESGLLIGFILPGGDTTLLLAGSFAATGVLPLPGLLAVVVLAAIAGDNVGYEFGKRTGKRIFKKEESILFSPEHLLRAEKFYHRHGGKTIMLARFVPMVRTFAPLVAGVGNMPRRRFLFFNVIGACVWGVGVTMLGYGLARWLGSSVEELDKYLLAGVGITTVAAFGPALYQLGKLRGLRRKKRSAQLERELEKAAASVEKDVRQ